MNILTFDIEEWYLEKVFNGNRGYMFQQFNDALERLLLELERRQIKATFFCVGKLAKDFPEVIRCISSHGHEIGCHSNEHTWIDKMDEMQLRRDTSEAVKYLEDVSGQKVVSYRAPAFSITPHNKWAINVLADCGIENDASIFPSFRDFGGYNDFPTDEPCVVVHEGVGLKEFPICLTAIIGKKIAYSGGGYFRILPYWFISSVMNRRDYNIFYFHLKDLLNEKIVFLSKEAYEDYFKEKGTFKNRFIRYVKDNATSGNTFNKLSKLFMKNEMMPLEKAVKMVDWEKVKKIKI